MPPAGPRGRNVAGAVVGKADLAGRYRQQIGDLPVHGGSGLLALRRQQKNRSSNGPNASGYCMVRTSSSKGPLLVNTP